MGDGRVGARRGRLAPGRGVRHAPVRRPRLDGLPLATPEAEPAAASPAPVVALTLRRFRQPPGVRVNLETQPPIQCVR